MSSLDDTEIARSIFRESLDAFFVIDPDSLEVREANPAALRLTGYRKKELLKLRMGELLDADGRELPRSLVEAVQSTACSGIHDNLWLRGAEGKRLPVQVTASRIHTESKSLGLLLVRDRSEFWRDRDKILANEQRFRSLFDASPDAVFVEDFSGRVLDVNPAACILHGMSREQLLGKNVLDLVPPCQQEQVRQDFQRLVCGEINTLQGFSRTADGRDIPVELRAQRIDYLNQPALLLHVRDITQRIEAKRFLTRIAEASPLIIYVFDLVCRRNIYINRIIARDLGYFPEEIQQMGDQFLSRLLHPDDLARVPSLLARWDTAKDDEIFEIEYRMRHRDGSWHWFIGRDTVFARDASGRVTQFLGIAQDVTELKRIHQQLEQRNRLLDSLSRCQSRFLVQQDNKKVFEDLLQTLLTVTESEYGFIGEVFRTENQQPYLKTYAITNISWDEATRRLYEENEARGLEFYNLKSLFGVVMTTGEPVLSNDPANDPRRGGLPPGHPPLHAFLGLPFRQGTEVIGIVGLANRPGGYNADVIKLLEPFLHTSASLIVASRSERARRDAEARLLRSERRYLTTLASIGDAVVACDPVGRVTFLNPVAEALTGWTCAEAMGRPMTEVVPLRNERSNEPMENPVEQAIRLRSTVGLANGTVLVTRDGREIPIEDSASPIRDEDGEITGVVLVFRDVTAKRQAEEQRRRLEQQMLHAQKLESLGVLAGGIAHDFNNLLTGMLGYTNLAALHLPPDSVALSLLQEAEKTAGRAADLVRQLLAYAGKARFVIQSVDLNKLTSEMLTLLRTLVSRKAQVQTDFANNLPLIEADATQIRQVVMNLITNASEALNDREGTITLRTAVIHLSDPRAYSPHCSDEASPGTYVMLEVSDTGCGMNQETLSRVFDPFFTTKFSGRGLGLAAVLGIIRGHHGLVKIHSQPGQGTQFQVLFPATDRPLSAEPSVSERNVLGTLTGSGVVLVVDDEEPVRSLAARVLSSAGYQVVIAGDGEEALAAFRVASFKIRLVLLDLTMPGIDGLELTRRLYEIRDDIPVILMSGYGEPHLMENLSETRLAAFLQKPFIAETLLHTLRRVLAAESSSLPD